jgi:hypothetical protein
MSEFEQRLTQALEQQPVVVVPADFAARVRAALPEQRQVRMRSRVRSRVRVSQVAAVVSGTALLAAMCWLAPHSTVSFSSAAFDVELALLAELVGVLMVVRRDA